MKVRAVPNFAGNCEKNEKNSAANGEIGCRGNGKHSEKQQEKVENSTEKLQNGAAEAGKTHTKPPN